MRSLPKPVDEENKPYVPIDVFDLCISKVGDVQLKARLRFIRDDVGRFAANFESLAVKAELHRVPLNSIAGSVTAEEMISVYTKRMAKKGRPGRVLYDRLITAPKNARCPLCDLGTVNTLDHHLPKAEYPLLSVAPNNLVPACRWCQGAKKEHFPVSAGEQTIHPYYDNFEAEVWLDAEVVENAPASFRFFVHAPHAWDAVIVERLNSHLRAFNLRVLYAANAGSELAGIRARLVRLLKSGGKDEVRKHLQEEAASWEQESKNSWRAAMFRAAAASDWFCDGGFALQ